MTSATGWYGPLIDLSGASSHIGHFVQLLVFVRGSTPVQYKSSKGGESFRTDIQVCDDTRESFFMSVWQKQMGSVTRGNVVLFQNVKIVKFGDIVQAKAVQCSSLLCLINNFEMLVSKGVDEAVTEFGVGTATTEKFRKVVDWLQRAQPLICRFTESSSSQKKSLSRNWKTLQETRSRFYFSLSQVLSLTNSCKAAFDASIGEIFLPTAQTGVKEPKNENNFISRRMLKLKANNLAEDLICTGCQLCECPLDQDQGKFTFGPKADPLYCERSSNHLHILTWIYRPFMLYVWDDYVYMPLIVRNKAAELLFGNIRAERVYESYRQRTQVCDSGSDKVLKEDGGKVDFYAVWLIIVKILLQQEENSPLRFDIAVNFSLDDKTERFEMVSVSMPCSRTVRSSDCN